MDPRAAAPLRILVTGAGGLIGGELCGALAERGHGVVALLRQDRAPRRTDGTPVAVRGGGLPVLGGVSAVRGDVAAAGLGLDPGVAARLAGGLDLIVHGAAVTGFALAPEAYQQVNVDGTAGVLAFAAAAGVPVLHVSTAYVCGDRDGRVPEAAASEPGSFANDYERSKAAGEVLVLAAQGRGLRVAVARPSIVAGRWRDGAIGGFGNLYQLVRLVMEGRVRVLPAAAGASLDLVPVDHVVGGLVDIAERMAAADGRIFHLASGAPVPVAALGRLAEGHPHLPAPVFVPAEGFDPAGLPGREQRWHWQATAAFAPYLRRGPVFETGNLLALSGRACPATDGAYLRRVIGYGVAAGFLPGPGARAVA